MNKRFTFLCLMLISLSTIILHSQPKVEYIIPDIGAPSMNVYVEFISNYIQKGNFGSDGLYMNNPGDVVRVVPANPADSSKVKIGPVIVSWEGRLISTQVFIHPKLLPNSTEALIVRPEFRIPLVVIVNGQRSNEQIFYIVRSRPYFDGVANPTELVFGEGALGQRSPRGAMIFDSIRLADNTYKISTNDCDPNNDGNQGYLPFNLLVRGKLTGSNSSMISADAIGKNAGPGGGGGGGRFYDAFISGGNNNGDDGGAGFVGGGAGGRNRNAMFGITDAYKNPGIGTGGASNSLNGVPFPANQAYESAAGGTGHPFGLSGTSCSDGNDCAPDGAYGAGSGVSQNRQGGAAGYANDGVGIGPSYGRAHGNPMNIPLAGGSGGAGGNPNWPDAYSGNGGGGGGAMSIFAHEISSVGFSAKGAAGSNPSGGIGNISYGGSGSGGALNILSKSTIENVKLYLDGGTVFNRRAGKGRHRIDGKEIGTGVTIETNDNTFIPEDYYGITTDTSHFIPRDFKFTGTQAKPGKNISSKFYQAAFDGEWMELTGLGFTDPPNGEWEMQININNKEPYICLVAVQDVPNPNSDEYLHEPIRVMSQAAANMFILDINPILVADSVAENMSVTCIGHQKYIETVIKNADTAGSDLQFNLASASWTFGNNGFEVVEPLGDITLAPGEEVTLRVRYTPNIAEKTNILNRLEIVHNDPLKRSPWYILFKVGDAFQPLMEFVGQPEDFIFPDTRIGGKSSKNIVLRNTGESKLLIEEYLPINPPFYVVGSDKSLPVILLPGEELRLIVEFRPTDESTSSEMLRAISVLTDTTCAEFTTQLLEGKGVFSSIDVNVVELDFGLIPWCEDSVGIISIQNPSTADFRLTKNAEIIGDNPEAFVINNTVVIPMKLTPGDGTQFEIKINGKSAGTGVKTALFRIETDVPETPVIEVILKAEIVGFDVDVNQNPINLGTVDIGFDYISKIILQNNARLPEKIEKVTSNQPASITIPNVNDSVITPNGGVIDFDVILNTSNSPVNNELTISFNDPCFDTIRIPYTLNYVIAKESAISGNQVLLSDPAVIDTIDYGVFSPCEDSVLKLIQFTNFSQGRYLVLNESLNNLSDNVFFMVGTGLIYPDTIQPSPDVKGAAQILFDPVDTNEGVYYAEYLISLYINGDTVQRKIILKGEVIDGDFEYSQLNTQFNSVVGLTDTQELVIKNNGPYEIKIISITTPNNQAFSWQTNINGQSIQVDGELKFNVVFKPSAVEQYLDSILVKISIGGCEKDFMFYLNGDGLPSKKLNVSIPKMIVEPTLNNFRIPIYGKLEKPEDNLENFTIDSLKITMRRSMFYPEKIIGGTLINSNLVGDNRVIEISIDNMDISNNDSLIAEIEGATLLGDVDYTDILISDIKYSMKEIVSEISSTDGSMETEICEEGGNRLLRMSNAGNSVSINPNPATDLLIISTKTLEKGNYQIYFTDMLGQTRKISEFQNPGTSDYEHDVSYPTNDLPSGNYVLKLQTPTEVITLQIVILK